METKLEQIAAKAVKQRPKSVVREIRTPRSVGTGGGRPPPGTLLAASFGKTARLWDAQPGDPIGKPLQHADAVRAAVFDPKGERVVTASDDKTARIWDARVAEP